MIEQRRWFVRRSSTDKIHGPISFEYIKKLKEAGKIGLDAEVRMEGSETWQRLGDILNPPSLQTPKPTAVAGTVRRKSEAPESGVSWLLSRVFGFNVYLSTLLIQLFWFVSVVSAVFAVVIIPVVGMFQDLDGELNFLERSGSVVGAFFGTAFLAAIWLFFVRVICEASIVWFKNAEYNRESAELLRKMVK